MKVIETSSIIQYKMKMKREIEQYYWGQYNRKRK